MHLLEKLPISARYMILSSLGFALMAACVKLVATQGIPLLEIIAARALVSLVISYWDVRRRQVALLGNNRPLLFARAIIGTLALVCVYYSVTTMPLAEATILQYLHPMFTALIAWLALRERIDTNTIWCIILSLAGLILIAQPAALSSGNGSDIPTLALVAAIMGAFGSALAYVIVRKLAQTEDSSVIIFYFPFIALPFSLVLLGDAFVIPQGTQWLLLLAVGIFTQIGQHGLTKAMQTETAGRATAFSYVQILFSAALGWWIFAEIPDLFTWLGAGLIVLGALINLRRSSTP